MHKPLIISFLLVLNIGSISNSAENLNPTQTVKDLITLIRNESHMDALSNIDVGGLSQYCLSQHWDGQSNSSKEEFISLLGNLLVKVAFSESSDFFDEIEIEYTSETIQGDKAAVSTTVEHPDEGEI